MHPANLQCLHHVSTRPLQNLPRTSLDPLHDRTLSEYGAVRSDAQNILWREVVVQTLAVFASDVLSVRTRIGNGFTHLV
jgi:hypothetical protein